MSLFFGIFASYQGALIGDYSSRVRDLEFSTNEHGFAALTCFVPLSLAESFALYDRPGLPHVVISDNGATVWEGRLEDVAIVNGGVRLGAFGYWRAFSDVLYSAFWSKDTVEDFQVILETDVAGRSPQMYTMDTSNRLFIGLNKSASYRSSLDSGDYFWHISPCSSRQIGYVSFAYSYDLPTNWTVRVGLIDSGFANAATASNITTTGGVATGTYAQDVSGSPRDGVLVRVFNTSGASYLNPAESGSKFARFTSVRVTSSGSTIYADEVVKHILSLTSTLNASQINSSSALIQSPSLDLTRLSFEDTVRSDALTYLANLGDNQATPKLWEIGVYENQLLHFRERASAGRAWMVDAGALEVERTLASMYNSMYAIYTDEDRTLQRSSTCTDSDSVTRYGVTRRTSFSSPTSSSPLAVKQRDMALNETKDPIPRISIKIERLTDNSGGMWPLWMCRSGDTITIRNLPPTLSTTIDRIRTFRVAETTYRADSNTLDVTPETPTPKVEVLLAQQDVSRDFSRIVIPGIHHVDPFSGGMQ